MILGHAVEFYSVLFVISLVLTLIYAYRWNKHYDINLTEIHSVPDRSEIWNYFFMIELDAAFTEESTKALIYQLMNETEAFRLLGSYKC